MRRPALAHDLGRALRGVNRSEQTPHLRGSSHASSQLVRPAGRGPGEDPGRADRGDPARRAPARGARPGQPGPVWPRVPAALSRDRACRRIPARHVGDSRAARGSLCRAERGTRPTAPAATHRSDQAVQVLGGRQLERPPSLAGGQAGVVHAVLLRGWLGGGAGGLPCRSDPLASRSAGSWGSPDGQRGRAGAGLARALPALTAQSHHRRNWPHDPDALTLSSVPIWTFCAGRHVNTYSITWHSYSAFGAWPTVAVSLPSSLCVVAEPRAWRPAVGTGGSGNRSSAATVYSLSVVSERWP
jgi:hypothetical protein